MRKPEGGDYSRSLSAHYQCYWNALPAALLNDQRDLVARRDTLRHPSIDLIEAGEQRCEAGEKHLGLDSGNPDGDLLDSGRKRRDRGSNTCHRPGLNVTQPGAVNDENVADLKRILWSHFGLRAIRICGHYDGRSATPLISRECARLCGQQPDGLRDRNGVAPPDDELMG